MNPSSQGWISKYVQTTSVELQALREVAMVSFYEILAEIGFIYGVSNLAISEVLKTKFTMTKEELTKVNLLHSLIYIYVRNQNIENVQEAVPYIVQYYKDIERGKTGFFSKLSFTKSANSNLEAILATRLQETNSQLKLENVNILTYALLFIDILAFRRWLEKPEEVKQYITLLESTAIACCVSALKAKKNKKKYDFLLIDLFASSSEYLAIQRHFESDETVGDYFALFTSTEKSYLLDLCCMAVWDDHEMDTDEFRFLKQFAKALHFSEEKLEGSIERISSFAENSEKKIKLFEYSNPVKLFYKQSVATVKLLILRNQKRLLQELNESGELLKLLSNSTVRDLSPDERFKVKEQLLDICKTIPSLTIFLLPGGTVLLPLLIKFIPKLLPSAFDENRMEDISE